MVVPRVVVEGRSVEAALVTIGSFYSPVHYLKRDRAVLLKKVLTAVRQWQLPSVFVVLVTQNASGTQHSLERVACQVTCAPDVIFEERTLSSAELAASRLAFSHRRAIEEMRHNRSRANASPFGLYANLDEDTLVTWAALKAWAADEELFFQSPYSGVLHRGFWRYELNNGHAKVADHPDGTYAFLKDLSVATPCIRPNLTAWRCKVELAGGRRFVGLANPYQAMWIMGPARLEAFMRSRQWKFNTLRQPLAGYTTNQGGISLSHGNVKEAGSWGDTYVNLAGVRNSSGGRCSHTNLLVPYSFVHRASGTYTPPGYSAGRSGGDPTLELVAGIQHLGSDYDFRPPNKWLHYTNCLLVGGARE